MHETLKYRAFRNKLCKSKNKNIKVLVMFQEQDYQTAQVVTKENSGGMEYKP